MIMRSIGPSAMSPAFAATATVKPCHGDGVEHCHLGPTNAGSAVVVGCPKRAITRTSAPSSPIAQFRSPRLKNPQMAMSQRLLMPSSPVSQFRTPASPLPPWRSPLPKNRVNLAGTSQSVSQAGQQAQSKAACAAPPDVFRQLQAVIADELHAYCKTLVADAVNHLQADRGEILTADAMNHWKAGMDERLKAEQEVMEVFAKQLQAFEQKLQCLAAGMNNMEMRLSKTASLQLSAHAEHQTFENHATAVLESLEGSLQEVHRNLKQASIPQFSALTKQACGNFMHVQPDNGGQLHPPLASSNAPSCATGKGVSLGAEQFQVGPETSNTIEVLEATLASMQEHEHEQIRRLREKIQHTGVAHGGCNGAIVSSWSVKSG